MINNILKKSHMFYKLANLEAIDNKETIEEPIVSMEPTNTIEPQQYKSLADRMLELGERKTLKSPLIVSHRSSNLNLTQKELDPLAIRKTRQSKGKTPKVGLYTYDIENDVPRYGENKINIELPIGTEILDIVGVKGLYSSRISLDDANKLLSNGIDVVRGKDFIGPPEYIILKMPK